MKPIAAALLPFAVMLGLQAGQATAQEEGTDLLSKMIWDMFQMRRGKTLCLAEATPLLAVRANVSNHLRRMGAAIDPSPQEVAVALWTLYPCPFSPYRAELRPATAKEIQGAWLFPESSQKLRPRTRPFRPDSVVAQAKCDAVGYYPNGEVLQAAGGQSDCPFETAADLDGARPHAALWNWALLREGRIRVTRPEAADQLEEWDVYAVAAPFQVDDVQFKTGDLVTYARRGKGNDVNAATQFRHLQRLQ